MVDSSLLQGKVEMIISPHIISIILENYVANYLRSRRGKIGRRRFGKEHEISFKGLHRKTTPHFAFKQRDIKEERKKGALFPLKKKERNPSFI
jgi:hypothetical protein